MKRKMKIRVPIVLTIALLSLIYLGMVGAAIVPVVTDVVKDPTEVPPPLIRHDGPQTVIVNLVAKEVIAELVPANPLAAAKQFKFWTYALDQPGAKATVPGPMIRVMEGDTVVINLRNDINNIDSHNIDFHAAMGPGGGASVTNVKPGETATLKFKAMRAGAYIYHCAGEGKPWEHVAHGMYGLIMVEPVGGLSKVDKEFYVGQSDWYLTDTPISDPGNPSVKFYDLNQDKASIEHPDYYTLNGNTQALTTKNMNLISNQGDKVRIFMVTGGPNIGSNFHIIGQIFDKVYTGSSETFVKNEETFYVAPGSASVFELSTLVPGTYSVVDHALWRVPKGTLGFLHVNARVTASCSTKLPSGAFTCTNPGSWPFDIFSPIAFGTVH